MIALLLLERLLKQSGSGGGDKGPITDTAGVLVNCYYYDTESSAYKVII